MSIHTQSISSLGKICRKQTTVHTEKALRNFSICFLSDLSLSDLECLLCQEIAAALWNGGSLAFCSEGKLANKGLNKSDVFVLSILLLYGAQSSILVTKAI